MRSHVRRLTAAEQHFLLKHSSIARGSGFVRRQQLEWEFDVQPTPLSRVYRVRIKYIEGTRPRVMVTQPDLTKLAGDRADDLPHVYNHAHPVRLCLYNPNKLPWTSEWPIATTIVPWIYLWLYFFEEWLFSNDWKGGGEHAGENDDEEN